MPCPRVAPDSRVRPVKVVIPECVLSPLSSGTVAPEVPMSTVADVPRPKFVRAPAAVVAPVPPLVTAVSDGLSRIHAPAPAAALAS